MNGKGLPPARNWSRKHTERSPAQIEHDRQVIAGLYLQQVPTADIAEQIGVSERTIYNDLRKIREEWQASSIRDFARRRGEELPIDLGPLEIKSNPCVAPVPLLKRHLDDLAPGWVCPLAPVVQSHNHRGKGRRLFGPGRIHISQDNDHVGPGFEFLAGGQAYAHVCATSAGQLNV